MKFLSTRAICRLAFLITQTNTDDMAIFSCLCYTTEKLPTSTTVLTCYTLSAKEMGALKEFYSPSLWKKPGTL